MFDLALLRKATHVGYLSSKEDYPRGEAAEEVMDRLIDLAKHPLYAWGGHHDCDLEPCGSGQVQPELKYRGLIDHRQCSTDIVVPGKSVVYVAPTLILHYIWYHKYLPPYDFLEAVLACPKAETEEYFAALNRACSG